MPRFRISFAASLALALAASAPAIAQSQIATSEISFPRGASSATVNGTINGEQTHDYVVRASAGQEMKVDLSGSDIVFFNVLAPGSNDEAIFIGSNEGNHFGGTLGVSGAYKIRVYQMRASARRGERGPFTLAVAVTGAAASGGGSHASSGGGGSGGGLAGLSGTDSIAAIDTMTDRGFTNVDSFESGNTQYGIFYNRSTRVCAQLTMADGKVVDARDIQTHAKCR